MCFDPNVQIAAPVSDQFRARSKELRPAAVPTPVPKHRFAHVEIGCCRWFRQIQLIDFSGDVRLGLTL
jgi:hypothetical protein